MLRKALIAIMIGSAFIAEANAENARPLLSPVFSDHAVLQRGRPLALWGWAASGEAVEVAFADRVFRSTPGGDGAWRVTLPALEAGGPYSLSVRSNGKSAEANDILIGDVFLCSGQSNMEFATREATDAVNVAPMSADNSLRLLHVTRRTAFTAAPTIGADDRWSVASPDTVGDFSAVCYFFGRELRRTTKAPIGLIAASWGGTPIEAWMDRRALKDLGGFEDGLSLYAEIAKHPEKSAEIIERDTRNWWNKEPGARAGYWKFDFDASGWPQATPDGVWENWGDAALSQFDGIAWFRSEFNLTEAQAAMGGEFSLGPADDRDITYLNGVEIGATNGWDTRRRYRAPRGALRAGRNVIASAVLDTGGGGGWWGPADEKILTLDNGEAVRLGDRPWRYRISTNLADLSAKPLSSDSAQAYSALYNGMIAPIAPYAIAGALWYQGENNAAAPENYMRLLPAMMSNWRRAFGNPEMPFFIAQLSSFGAPAAGAPTSGWGAIRDVQRRVVDADKYAALIVTYDVGDRFDIHPAQKRIVGERMARAARRLVYGEDIVVSGPAPVSAQREGDDIVVRFNGAPLIAYGSNRPIAFEICDQNRQCRFVDAAIEDDAIRLDAADGAKDFVRYCWGAGLTCNLYNDSGLPASPFEIAVP